MGEKKLSAVLVHVDGTKAAAGRVAFAGALADDFDSAFGKEFARAYEQASRRDK